MLSALFIFVLFTSADGGTLVRAASIHHSNLTDMDKGRQLVGLVKKGMDAEDVNAVLGGPCDEAVGIGNWHMDCFWWKYRVNVSFDSDGKVTAKSYLGPVKDGGPAPEREPEPPRQ